MFNKLILFIAVVIISISCKREELKINHISPLEINPEIGVPIAFGEYSIFSLLKDNEDNIMANSQNDLMLEMSNNLSLIEAQDLLSLNEKEYRKEKELSNLEMLNLKNYNSVKINYKEEHDFTIDGKISMELNSVEFLEGELRFALESTIEHNSNIMLTIPDLQKNSRQYQKELRLGPKGKSQFQIDLKDYTLKLKKSASFKNKTFIVLFDVLIEKGSSSNLNGSLVSNLKIIKGTKFKHVYGNIKKQELTQINNFKIPVDLGNMDDIKSSIELENAILKLKWENSFGMGSEIQFKSIVGKGKGNISYCLDTKHFDAENAVITASSTSGNLIKGEIVIDNKNTFSQGKNLSLKDFINKDLEEIIMNVIVVSNEDFPLGKKEHRISHSDELKIDFQLIIPLHGTIKDLVFEETFDFSLNESMENISSFDLVVFASNSLPVDVYSEFELLDKNGNLLFAFEENQYLLIKSAEVNPLGTFHNPTTLRTSMSLKDKVLQLMPQVKKLKMKSICSTINNGMQAVKFKKLDKLEIKFGARFNYKINVEL